MPAIDLSILNQRQTPAFYADVFANRPAAGFVGRIFVSTNTFAFYRDNGTGWDLIGGPGTGTITGSGTSGQIALWDGASTITGDSGLTYDGTANSLTASKFIVTGGTSSQFLKADGSVDSNSYVPYTGATTSLNMGANNISGQNYFINGNGVNSGGYLGIKQYSGTSSGSLGYTSLYAALQNSLYIQYSQTNSTVKTVELSSGLLGTTPRQYQFPDADGTLALTSDILNIYNSNGTLSAERTVALNGHNLIFDGGASVARVRLDADTNVARIFSFATNNVARWAFRIDDAETGSNAGSNFAVRRYDDAGAFVDSPLLINRATGQSTFAKKVVIENNAGDQQLQIVSTTAPSLRIDNLQTGATKRVGIGLSTNVNNFIQGSVDRDFCVFNSSTTASPILFGIYDAGLTNTQEAARISAARNFLVGGTVDGGQKLQVTGTSYIDGAAFFNSTLETRGNIKTLISTTTGVPTIYTENNVGSITQLRTFGTSAAGTLFGITRAGYSSFDSNNGLGLLYGTTDNAPIIFGTNNIERFRVSNTGLFQIGGSSSAKLTVKEVTTGYTGYFGESQTSAASNGLIALQSGRIPQSGGDTTGKSGFEFLHSYGTGGVNGDANGGYIESIRESVFGTPSAVNTSLTFGTASANVNGEVFRITATKNLLISTTTDSGEKLQVNGQSRLSGRVLLNSSVNNNYLAFNHSGVQTWYQKIVNTNNSSFIISSDYLGGTNYLTITEAGVSTFSGSVNIGNSVAAAVGVASTHKVSILINGVQYYLLASNV